MVQLCIVIVWADKGGSSTRACGALQLPVEQIHGGIQPTSLLFAILFTTITTAAATKATATKAKRERQEERKTDPQRPNEINLKTTVVMMVASGA